MKVTIYPSQARGTVTAPPSKSMAHRLLIAGALSSGSCVKNVAYSQDVLATLDCLGTLGATVRRKGDTIYTGGLNLDNVAEDLRLNCRESGSTLRFLIPLCLLCGKPITLEGSKRLMERPLTIYKELCETNGFRFEQTEDSVTVCGRLKAAKYGIDGNVSSQFVTGLLFALSLIDGDSSLDVFGVFASRAYVDMTISAMKQFGVTVDCGENAFLMHGAQTYAPSTVTVEGDYSNAAFLEAFNLLGGDVKVSGLSSESAQGDRVYRDFYQKLGTETCRFDLTDCPDLGPVMFALAAACGGAKFTGVSRLRMKESDRIDAMTIELRKFGVTSRMDAETVEILPCVLTTPREELCAHNDHRIVMALSLLCSITGGTIVGAEAVAKSYPDYFKVIQSLGIEMSFYDFE